MVFGGREAEMNEIGRILILIGLTCLVAGCLFYLFGKIPGLGKMPGDIMVKRENFTFYFPIVSCLLISLVLSLIMFFLNKR